MKKIFYIFAVLSPLYTFSAQCETLSDCIEGYRTKSFLIWGEYDKLPQNCKNYLTDALDIPIASEGTTFTCGYTKYQCKKGQKPSECAPCAISLLSSKYSEDFQENFGTIACNDGATNRRDIVFDKYEAKYPDWTKAACEKIFSTSSTTQSNPALPNSQIPPTPTASQSNTNIKWPIRGTVFDNNGKPLPYANVIIPGAKSTSGSACGANTDLDGDWAINNCTDIPSDPKLKITFTGYTPQEIPLSSFKNGDTITLAEDSLTLTELLVTECRKTDPNYPGATNFKRASDGKCYPTECNEPAYKLVGTAGTKNAKCESQKCKIDNAITTHWETTNMQQWVCIADNCKSGYKQNTDKTACIKMLNKCTAEQNKAHPNASETGIKEGTNPEQCIALECKCGYDLVNEQCVAWPATGKNCTADTKPELPSHATGAIMKCNDKGKPYCEVSGCENNYTKNDSNTKCEKLRGECTHTDPNVKKAKYKKVDGNRICVITKCNDGYMPSDDGQKCEVSEGPCNETQLATVENATKGELKKGKCRATECKPGYEVEKHKCVEIAGNCPDKPENAKKSHREFDSNTQAEVCIIDECKDGYKVSDDSKSCIEIEKPKLSREDSQAKIDELQKNADAMKEKEQSTANKLLGGAAIGATGIGAMQAASAYSEQQADEEAEQAMRAYLATFHCNYGGGINVPGGEKDVQLPGGNELIDLYAEYVNLANNLKVRKAALDLRPGIESEAILDSATSGLYDDVAIGKTSGAFTSLARALQDPEGEDAKAWAAQKDDSAQKMKTGLTVAGIGAVGGAVGNLIINRNSEKENSKEINAKYEKLKKKLEEDIAAIPPQTAPCPSDTSGSKHPNCTCNDTSKIFNPDTNACDSCSGGKIAQNGECVCPSDKPLWDNANNQCIARPTSCTPQCKPNAGDHLTIQQDCSCTCLDGYDYQDGKCTCTGNNKKEQDGKCITTKTEIITEVIQTFTNTSTSKTVENAVLPAGSLFKIGSYELLEQAKTALNNFVNGLKDGGFSECELTITGYTDPVGGEKTNTTLSENRAKSVKNHIEKLKNSAIKTVKAEGKGENNCTCGTRNKVSGSIDYNNREYSACKDKKDNYTLNGNARFAPCRRVEISANCKKVTTTSESSTSTKTN